MPWVAPLGASFPVFWLSASEDTRTSERGVMLGQGTASQHVDCCYIAVCIILQHIAVMICFRYIF